MLSAQALVLRVWRYFQMVRVYGGVPMILTPQEVADDLYVSRNKTSECIDIMIKDLDTAIATLPWKWTGMTKDVLQKAAAMALKGRILLYYASPQFNPNGDKNRWETAYQENKKAMEQLAENGYGLYNNYENIWFDEMNEEAVFVTRYQEPGMTNTWCCYTPLVGSPELYRS